LTSIQRRTIAGLLFVSLLGCIWGAIETFWPSVPTGSSVEVCSYPSQHSSMGSGHTELYYIDGSAVVNGVGFSPHGVVYEPEGNA
jgi:hypothetical protein